MSDWAPGGVIVAKESTDPKDIQRQEEIMKQLEKAIEEGKSKSVIILNSIIKPSFIGRFFYTQKQEG